MIENFNKHNVILKMLFAFDAFSAIYVTLLVTAIGVKVQKTTTLFTSIPNIIIIRVWIGFIVAYLHVDMIWSWWWLVRVPFDVTFCYLIEDVYGYCFHRYCHYNKFLYNNVHKQHHENLAECFTTAFYIHPAEMIGFYFVGVIAGPLLLSYLLTSGISWLGLIVWLSAAEFYLFWSHTGYENPAYPWLPSTKFHADHHRYYACNYSSAWFDGLMGTLRKDKAV